VDRKEISEILHFSFYNYLGDLFWNLPGLVLPIIIINLLGAESNAYFYIAWAMSGILIMIPASVATSLLAEGSHDEVQLKNNIRRSIRIMAIILVPAVILVWFLADKLLLLYGGQYADKATDLLRWLAVAVFPLTINMVYFGIKRVQKNVKPVIILAVCMAVITILSSYLLLPKFGINGVGISWLFGQSVIAFVAICWDVGRWF
jgi:O-antigen/teichoic acid export membrane protein